jgi:hypothetical protein
VWEELHWKSGLEETFFDPLSAVAELVSQHVILYLIFSWIEVVFILLKNSIYICHYESLENFFTCTYKLKNLKEYTHTQEPG